MTISNADVRPANRNGDGSAARDPGEEEHAFWLERSRVVLSPVSAPSVLGLFGFAAATLIVSGDLAGWYGTPHSFIYFAPFCAIFGGVAQFLAGMWSYKARDTLATAMHGMWGSFWIAFAILWLMDGAGAISVPPNASMQFTGFGMWFVMLALITAIGAFAAVAKNMGLFATLGLLAAGSGCLAGALLSGSHGWQVVAGWVLVASCGAAVYTAAALLFADTYGRTILPLGEPSARKNIPGAKIMRPIEYPAGQPGVRMGQ